jgi:hypothetical protein
MLARYAHIRTAARRAAIATLESAMEEPMQPQSDAMLN